MSIFKRCGAYYGGDLSPISYIASNGYAATGGALPAGDAVNDLAIRFALATTAPAIVVPTGNGWLIPSGAGIVSHLESASAPTVAGAVGYKIVDDPGNEGAGAYTNAEALLSGIYRGVDPTNPIAAMAWASSTVSTTVTWPALTYVDPFAWILLALRTFNDVSPNAFPAGFTIRQNSARRALADSAAPLSSFAGASATNTGGGEWISCACAIRSQ